MAQVFLLLAAGSVAADAQEARRRTVDVQVSSITGSSVYLDQGREAGLAERDEVLLTVPGRGIITLTVLSVSRTSARCAMTSPGIPIDVGTRGTVSVPVNRFLSPDAPFDDVPKSNPFAREHPPWSQSLDDFDESTPLLAPLMEGEPRESPTRMRGRLFANYLHNINFQYGNNQYSRSFIGADVWYENPFQLGGGLHFDGQVASRGFGLYDEGDEFILEAWPTQMSYYWGGTDEEPFRIEAGRFFHYEFAELGLVDGTELIYRTGRGDRVGFSAGFLPEPFPNLQTGQDFQTSVFYRWLLDETEDLTAGIAFQKTWHSWISDRDLLVANVDYRPSSKVSLHAAMWGDFYDSHDTRKSTPFEITQSHLNGVYRINPRTGVGAHVTYLRWPDLLRNEYRPILDTYVQRNRVFRGGVYGWRELTELIRLDVRVDEWFDQDDNGTAWDLGVAFRKWPISEMELILGVYDTDGLYSSGLGGRVTVLRRFAKGYCSLGYDVGGFQYTPMTMDFLQHAVRLAMDVNLTSTVSCSLTGTYAFGNQQEALSAGVFLQKRF